jgi:hypothetical protein
MLPEMRSLWGGGGGELRWRCEVRDKRLLWPKGGPALIHRQKEGQTKATKIERTPEKVLQATCSEAKDMQVQFEVVTRQQVETMRDVEIR